VLHRGSRPGNLPATDPLPIGNQGATWGYAVDSADGMLRFMTNVDHCANVCEDPVFILTASRSGSTLLRFILDTHPDFACPPETMITGACVALLRSWDILENAGSGQQRLVSESTRLPADAVDTVRSIVDHIYGRYLARRGKPRWCDKSLDTLFNAELLAELYPRARFVCLYRHCMDVIASGIEACPWGVSRYGFDAYVAQHPGNSVAAIGGYWADNVGAILEFEQSAPDRCHRIRYEDLATAPEEVTADLIGFLGAAPMPGITTACFQTPHEGDGPGDEKIWFTTRVNPETMGRGVNVPAAALPSSVREKANQVLGKLGYRQVTDEWNDAPGPVDPRLPGSLGASGGPATGTAAGPAPAVVRALRERIRSRTSPDANVPSRLWPAVAGQTIKLVVVDEGRRGELSWTFPHVQANGDGSAQHADQDAAEPVATMIAGSQVWQALLDGTANVIVESHNGRLRCVNRRDGFRVRSDEMHAIAWLLGLAQVPLTRQSA
jgi:protein-tyrosine sulfotransferase